MIMSRDCRHQNRRYQAAAGFRGELLSNESCANLPVPYTRYNSVQANRSAAKKLEGWPNRFGSIALEENYIIPPQSQETSRSAH